MSVIKSKYIPCLRLSRVSFCLSPDFRLESPETPCFSVGSRFFSLVFILMVLMQITNVKPSSDRFHNNVCHDAMSAIPFECHQFVIVDSLVYQLG